MTKALCIGAIGAICTVIGGVMHDRRKHLLKSGIAVEGTVVSIDCESGVDESGNYYPVVNYRTLQNIEITKRYI